MPFRIAADVFFRLIRDPYSAARRSASCCRRTQLGRCELGFHAIAVHNFSDHNSVGRVIHSIIPAEGRCREY
jgi:hypothetical protein